MSAERVSTSASYWDALAREHDVARLRMLFEQRIGEFTPAMLPPPERAAIVLLERLAADGLLHREVREPPDASSEEEIVYVRKLAPPRVVDWVIAIHGMNSSGEWQESFTWQLSTTWGRSVPVAVYKYGIVTAGVLMPWRRGTLREALRRRIATLREEAEARGFSGRPDVIAHSFGTWLLGQLLEQELTRTDPLAFGRIVLTGSVLRPDFDWKRLKDAGLLEDVLNHYGTGDRVVPLAQTGIYDSGPSGRRGFDGAEVINVRADGFGHSELFSTNELERSYTQYWRPFLTLPREELRDLPEIADPTTRWRPWPWPLRGNVLGLLLLCGLIAWFALR
ncbi:MAG TPA: hypothetical protein VEK79_03160 [Thermoanaerobaculia bacterium]|nr:hypothetical protein [Thermoanaerobaculia bacterium]